MDFWGFGASRESAIPSGSARMIPLRDHRDRDIQGMSEPRARGIGKLLEVLEVAGNVPER